MAKIFFCATPLSSEHSAVVAEGFARHTATHHAPPNYKHELSWLATDEREQVVGAVTAQVVWDWMYIDELWVDESLRGSGLGRELMHAAEQVAVAKKLVGVWLWTQSWQAEGFYQHLGYERFTVFENFPRGHQRIGLRKTLSTD